MVTNKENLFKLGKKMTDRIPYKLGLKPMTEDCPEYWGMANILTDEMVEVALTMKQRTPTSLRELVERTGKDEQHLEALLQEMATIGLLEYGWEGKEHTRENKRYVLPLFVPGAAELFNMNNKVVSEHPEVCDFFERMTRLPLEGLTEMIPPGGAGVGMHVIPVEKAIPAQSQSLSIAHISHWLKKYAGHLRRRGERMVHRCGRLCRLCE